MEVQILALRVEQPILPVTSFPEIWGLRFIGVFLYFTPFVFCCHTLIEVVIMELEGMGGTCVWQRTISGPPG